jgi:hypothetical protein
MNPEIENLIKMALADGQVTDKEREIILRKAEKLGLDVDEVEMYLEGSLDHNKPHNSSIIIEDTAVNLENKPLISKIVNTRNFTPRKVKHLEPALLNHENELKLKISEFSDSKKVLLDNLEKLIDEIKIPQRDLIKIKSSVDKQINLKKDEFKNANANLGKFINEINTAIAKKYGGGKLIFDKPEDFIGLGYIELVKLIQTDGRWNLNNLKSKRKKIRLLLYFLCIPPFIYMNIILHDYEYIKNSGYKMLLGFVIILLLHFKAQKFYALNEENKFNFFYSDLNPIIREVRRKYSNEFDELVRLKNEIIRLELIQKNLKLKDIAVYEKFIKSE